MRALRLPLLAAALAIVVTTTMDRTGYLMFSALPLTALIGVFWLLQRLSRAEIGLTLGTLSDFGLAIAYPVVVLGAAAGVAYWAGAIDIAEANWRNVALNASIGSTVGTLMLLLTEEGFFRGWLWGSFRRSGLSAARTLVVTSLLFTAWHVSAVTSGTDYGLPWAQVPIYLVNVTLLGLIWGLLRIISGSVVVAGVSHAVWNAFAYPLFGFGTKVGELGIGDTSWLGPEVGYLGILLNGGFLLWLAARARRAGHLQSATPSGAHDPH